jgi:membrane protein involved in colicin uptake
MLSAVNQYADIYQTTAPSPSPKDVDSSAATQNSNQTKTKVSDQDQGLSEKDRLSRGKNQKDSLELSQEAEEIRVLQLRDREVRAHEAAHAAAGGAYAGSPKYTFERGPDGRTYATGGAVSIDISPIPGDPQATLQKAQQVRAAALAPAEPSGQDMKVAQKAQAMATDARIEISQQMSEDLRSLSPESIGNNDPEGVNGAIPTSDASSASSSKPSSGDASSIVHLSVYS